MHDFGDAVDLRSLVCRNVEQGKGHFLFLHVLEVAEHLHQALELLGAAGPNVNQNFPRVQHVRNRVKTLEPSSLSQNVEGQLLWMAVQLARVLPEHSAQSSKQGKLALAHLKQMLLCLSQVQVEH